MFNRRFETFDAERALLFDAPRRERLDVTESHALKEMLESDTVGPDDEALMMVINDIPFAFLTVQALHHGVIQGMAGNQPWMIAMCRVCNGGAVFDPRVHGKVHHFATYGIYNSMSLIGDLETQSYWDHIIGVALHGPLEGYVLETLAPLVHTTLGQALERHPDCRLVLSYLTPPQLQTALADNAFRKDDQRETPAVYIPTMTPEDTRLPRLDMGLGLWSEQNARYYPITTLHANNNLVFDRFEGRNVAVFVDPETDIPAAFYTDATGGEWRGETLHLNNGITLRNGTLYNGKNRQSMELPWQLAQRWFGFSYTFPDCEIYGRG